MDIKALRYFTELVRQQNFTRAAEALFVTQPTISKMIRSMEEELGQPLLNREGHSFTLTDSGQVLFARGQLILAQMQQLEAELADLQSLQHGRLALGIPPMVGHVYADLIRAYRSRYPKVELSIVEYGGRRIEQAVLEGELDLAITMLPTREEGALCALDLDSYPIRVVLPDLPRWREGGEIRLDSTPGQGSVFLFELTLPVAEAQAPAPVARPVPLGYEGPRRRILVVDDVAVNRQMLLALLQPLGFEVLEAADGQEALNQWRTGSPELILMDLVMPVMDGLEAIRSIRQAEASDTARGQTRLPIVALSANAADSDQAQARDAGADDFLSKPVAHAELLDRIATALDLQWTHRPS